MVTVCTRSAYTCFKLILQIDMDAIHCYPNPMGRGPGEGPYLVSRTNIFTETLNLIYALLISNKARASKGILDCSKFFLPMSHH
jgi:hypothetical protein